MMRPALKIENAKTPRIKALALFGVLAFSLSSAAAHALTPATLVGPDLEPQAVQIISISEGRVGYFDASRQMQSATTDQFVQLRDLPRESQPAVAAPDEQPMGMIELTDGTRLTGRITGVADDGQALQWTHVQFGDVTVSVEGLAAVSPRGPLGRLDALPGDRAVMVNGDRIDGFVERLFAIKPDGAEAAVPLPVERLQRLQLANPPVASDLDRVHLHDGSRVLAAELTLTAGSLSATIALGDSRRSVTWPLTAVASVEFRRPGRSLVPLTDLAWRVTDGGEVFGVAWPPQVRRGALHLHAPVTVALDLPPGAARLAAAVELALDDVPPHQRTLADCRVILETPGTAPLVVRLDARQPRTRINLPVRPGPLILRLDPDADPTLDRVRLIEAQVLLDASP